jgi:hypothetical protein
MLQIIKNKWIGAGYNGPLTSGFQKSNNYFRLRTMNFTRSNNRPKNPLQRELDNGLKDDGPKRS